MTKPSVPESIAAGYLKLMSRLPRKGIKPEQALSHLQYNKSFSKINSELITDQRSCSRMRFGKSDMGYAGCEIIAVYNAVRLFGKEVGLYELIYYAESKGLIVRSGKWGTNPYMLAALGAAFDVFLTRQNNKITGLSEGIYILSFWNSTHITGGIHTVCLQIKNNNIITYNMTYSSRPQVHKIEDLEALFSGKPLVCCYSVSERQAVMDADGKRGRL